MGGLEKTGPHDEPARLPTGPEFARSLLDRALAQQTSERDDVADALHRVCAAVFSNLRASLGDEGCRALVARAFAAAHESHPALRTICGPDDCALPLDRILASTETHGAGPTRSAVEALLAGLVDILARLIGADMTIQILDPENAPPEHGGGAGAP